MDDRELKKVLSDYCEGASNETRTDQSLNTFELVLGWSRNEPELCWRLIKLAIHSDVSEKFLFVIAAGPLEDLLGNHGESIIDKLETEVRRERNARTMVSGVWQGEMSNEMWAKFQKMRERYGILPR